MASSGPQGIFDDMWSLHSTSQDTLRSPEPDIPVTTTPTTNTHPIEPPDVPHDAQEPGEPPPYDDVSDSGFDSGSLLGDETDTLASSIMNYRIENGRQYHSYRDGAYWGPNDEPAKEILDFAHHMYLLTLDHKLHLAPIKNPQVRICMINNMRAHEAQCQH